MLGGKLIWVTSSPTPFLSIKYARPAVCVRVEPWENKKATQLGNSLELNFELEPLNSSLIGLVLAEFLEKQLMIGGWL